MLMNIVRLDGQLPQALLKSLLIVFCALGKPSNLKFNFQDQALNIQIL